MTSHNLVPPVLSEPGAGPVMPLDATGQTIIAAFTRILLEEKTADSPCFLDRIFTKAEPYLGLAGTPPDVLLSDMLLFEPHRVPRYTNLFCADCGLLTERLMTVLFEITRGEMIDASGTTMKALEGQYDVLRAEWDRQGSGPRKRGKFPTWKKADFIINDGRIIECKYRFNSYEGKQKQIRIAEVYAELGYAPVFLHLSSDFRDYEDFVSSGWLVYSGEEMLDFIRQETGYDFRDLLARVSAQPIVRQRILDAHDEMIEKQKAVLRSSYFYAPAPVRTDFVEAFSNDRQSMEDLSQVLDAIPSPDITVDRLREHTEAICDAEQQNLPGPLYDALLGILLKLDEQQKSDLLMETLRTSTPRTRAEVTSVYG